MRIALTVLVTLSLSGCSTARDWTVGQQSVPQHESITESQREAERTAADYLSRSIAEPLEAMTVARRLSDLVGAPVSVSDDSEKIMAALDSEIRDLRTRTTALEGWIRTNEGRTIEGTGWSPFGWLPGSWFTWALALIAIVALGGGPLLWLALRATRRALRTLVRGLEDVSQSDPNAARKVKARLKQLMPADQQLRIEREKLTL